MTLKEELEILRGEPIQVFTGDPMDIPCIETSDPEKLCKHPVVSVHMITYNHEPYIRQAIEGVMMQKTDFEFELVIGEDCSTDRTREICFEYQKRYPDKIRVLWCDHNLYRNPHPAGGNSQRNFAHCRGEFIAFCEGDDYWIDPLKLQKQVDVMRKYPNVGIVTGAVLSYDMTSHVIHCGHRLSVECQTGVIAQGKIFLWLLYGMNPLLANEFTIHTSTILLRSSTLRNACNKYFDLFSFKFYLGDLQLFLAMTAVSDIFIFDVPMSVYRRNGGGLMSHEYSSACVRRDGMLTVFYFTKKELGFSYSDIPSYLIDSLFHSACRVLRCGKISADRVINYYKGLCSIGEFENIVKQFRYRGFIRGISRGKLLNNISDFRYWYCIEFLFGRRISKRAMTLYCSCAHKEFCLVNKEMNQDFLHVLRNKCKRLYWFLRYCRVLLSTNGCNQ